MPDPGPDPAAEPAPAAEPQAPKARSLDADALSAVLREHDRELQRCYEDAVVAQLMAATNAAPSDPAPVRLDVELTVEATGAVGKLTLGGDAPQAMRDCARNAIQAWHFPAATAPTEVRFPMVFQPNIVRQ